MASVDDSYRLLAARFVRKQVGALSKQLDGTREAEDIECVHQARVASRRLRAAMRMFRSCFPAGKLKKWRGAIRRVTSGLGAARDKDVQIEFVEGFLEQLSEPAARPGVRRLLLRLRQQREALQPTVAKSVARLKRSGVLKDVKATTKAMLAKLADREVTIQSPLVFLRSERLILRRLEKLLTYRDCLADPLNKPRHHEMRIVTKRLRYTMEICRPVYDGEIDDAVAAARQLQQLLGDIHDCDLWIETLPEFVRQERERAVEYFGSAGPFNRLNLGLEHLQDQRQRQREETFAQVGEYWKELREQAVWDRTVATVLSRVQQPAVPASSAEAETPPPPDGPREEETDQPSPPPAEGEPAPPPAEEAPTEAPPASPLFE